MITEPLDEDEATDLFPVCGVGIEVAWGRRCGKRELSGLAKRMRDGRESESERERQRLW